MNVVNQGKDDTASKVEHKTGKYWLHRDYLVSSDLIPTIGDRSYCVAGTPRTKTSEVPSSKYPGHTHCFCVT